MVERSEGGPKEEAQKVERVRRRRKNMFLVKMEKVDKGILGVFDFFYNTVTTE